MHAVRNIRLCTKDCLCLYVCPTGATDTETGQIDASRCVSGCRACVDACPSHAISLDPEQYPAQQEKTQAVRAALRSLAASKVRQEQMASRIAATADNPNVRRLARALAMSNRLMAEDLLRESGFMLSQSQPVLDLLNGLLEAAQPDDFPADAAKRLLTMLHNDREERGEETTMEGNNTLKNLMDAFAGESQANRKYLAYSKKAEKDGNMNAAKLFRVAADAETLHALKHFEVAGKVGTTADNLADAVAGETHEYKEMYPAFVQQAEAEGNKAAVMSFTFAMKAEEVHAKLYKEALESLDQTEEVTYYLCPVCGNIERTRPDKCSICGTPGDKFIKY
jgi:rubrerythrin